MPRAAIDLGSNSILLVVAGDDGAVLHDEARVVGLGRGLGDRGLLAPDRIRAAEAAITDYLEVCRGHGVEPWAIKAVATSAARRAMNAGTWLGRLKRRFGLQVDIISGEDEARWTWRGARSGLELPDGPLLVVDLGGGSTELSLGWDRHLEWSTSLEVGSVRLTEAFLGTDRVEPGDAARLRNHLDTVLGQLGPEEPPVAAIGVAGTVTTLAAIVVGLEAWDEERLHGMRLGRDDLARCIDLLLPLGPEGRRALVPVAPERADYLVAGAALLDKVLEVFRRPHLVVSTRGLRYGLLRG